MPKLDKKITIRQKLPTLKWEGAAITDFSKTQPFQISGEGFEFKLSDLQEYTITIPKNTILEKPITIKLQQTKKNLAFSLVVHVCEGSEVTIIEDWNNCESPIILYNQSSHVAAGAKLRHITLQTASGSIMETRKSEVASGGEIHHINYQLSGKKVKGEIINRAIGENAILNTDLILYGRADQNLDFTTLNDYTVKDGRGEVKAKAIATDESQIRMHGTLKIDQTGGGTQTYLSQDTLNLSPKAKVKTIPALKIDTNDVKASHGASVRNLNPEDLFYFASRGVDQEEARKMLIEGFIKESFHKLDDLPKLQEQIKQMI